MQREDLPSTRTALAALLLLIVGLSAQVSTATNPPAGSRLPRLYVLDCGAIHVADTARYELRRDEVDTSELSVACFLVVHPKGALIWDVGACRVTPENAKPTLLQDQCPPYAVWLSASEQAQRQLRVECGQPTRAANRRIVG